MGYSRGGFSVATFVKGEVVVMPFPYSDFTATKRRPALVVAALGGDDVILCPITSQSSRDQDAVMLTNADFQQGTLQQSSNIRPGHLITADEALILYRVGTVTTA